MRNNKQQNKPRLVFKRCKCGDYFITFKMKGNYSSLCRSCLDQL